MKGRDTFYRIDYPLVISMMLLIVMGILMIYSAGFDPIDRTNTGLYKKQILWFIFGFVIMIGITYVNYQQIGDYSLYIYCILLFVLVITTLFGKSVRNTKAWLNFGFFSIQPSEFMKLGLVIILGKYLELRERDMGRFRELMIPALLTLVPVLVILKQPDFGTAIIFIPILFTMLFVGGADVSHLIGIISIAAIAMFVPMLLTYREWVGAEGSNFILDFFKDINLIAIVSSVLLVVSIGSYIFYLITNNKFVRRIYIPGTVLSMGLLLSFAIQKLFKDYQKKRILVFLNPDLDPHGSGYNIIQSKIAIGSGGFVGKGFASGSQAQLGFLPEKFSDFIFSMVSEEFGFIGAVIMLGLFIIIIYKGIQISFESKDKFGALLASGITSIFFFHVFVNIGMAVGIMPVTGLPLSFVSYGGSNLLMCMMAIGILNNISMRKFVY